MINNTAMNTAVMMSVMNSSNSSGGDVSNTLGLIIILGSIYACQVLVIWCFALMDDCESKKQFLWWHVPFIPFFVLLYDKYKEMK